MRKFFAAGARVPQFDFFGSTVGRNDLYESVVANVIPQKKNSSEGVARSVEALEDK